MKSLFALLFTLIISSSLLSAAAGISNENQFIKDYGVFIQWKTFFNEFDKHDKGNNHQSIKATLSRKKDLSLDYLVFTENTIKPFCNSLTALNAHAFKMRINQQTAISSRARLVFPENLSVTLRNLFSGNPALINNALPKVKAHLDNAEIVYLAFFKKYGPTLEAIAN